MNVIVLKLSHLKSLEDYGHKALLVLANNVEGLIEL